MRIHPRAASAALLAACALLALTACTAAGSGGTADIVDAVPLVDGERYDYALEDVNGVAIGHGRLETRRVGDRFVLEQRFQRVPFDAGDDPLDRVTLTVDAATLRPIEGARDVDTSGRAGLDEVIERYEWRYEAAAGDEPARMVRTRASGRAPGAPEEQTLRLRDHYYDNESSLWLWRTIAFVEGDERRYVSANAIDGLQTTVSVTVPLRQDVEVPAGTFDTWRIIVRTGRAVRTAWIEAAPPHRVVQWDNGEVRFRLEASVVPE